MLKRIGGVSMLIQDLDGLIDVNILLDFDDFKRQALGSSYGWWFQPLYRNESSLAYAYV